MDSNGRMDRVERDLAWLAETLAESAAKHDERLRKNDELLQMLSESAARHDRKFDTIDEQIQAIVGATRVLLQKSDYWDEQIQKSAERADRIDKQVEGLNEQFERVYQLSQKNEEHIGILIAMNDEWIRNRGKEKE